MIDNMTNKLRNIMLSAICMIAASGTAHGGCEDPCAPICCVPTPCCNPCFGDFILGGRALYLRAYEGGLSSPCDRTEVTNTVEDDVLVSTLEGRNHDPDFDWNLGFSVGAGYQFADSNCGLAANWLHYHSHSGNGSDDNEHHWKLNYDVVDLVYYCDCGCSSCFDVIPFAGVSYGRIDQKLHTHLISSVDENPETSFGTVRQDFSGVGPIFGVELDWTLGCGFSLYGDIAGSVLFGRFHVHSNNTQEFDTGTNIDHLVKNTQGNQFVLDLGFGIRWETSIQTCFCCDKVLVLELGVEEHRFFNHNQFGGYGDLSLDGVSFGAALEF